MIFEFSFDESTVTKNKHTQDNEIEMRNELNIVQTILFSKHAKAMIVGLHFVTPKLINTDENFRHDETIKLLNGGMKKFEKSSKNPTI